MDFRIFTLIIESAPKFVKLVEDLQNIIENTKDPHQKNMLMEILDMLEEIAPKLNMIVEDLKAFEEVI